MPLASVNGSCTTGTIGIDSGGKILSCESSKWTLALAAQTPTPQYKSCPFMNGSTRSHGTNIIAEKGHVMDICYYLLCSDGKWVTTGGSSGTCAYSIPNGSWI